MRFSAFIADRVLKLRYFLHDGKNAPATMSSLSRRKSITKNVRERYILGYVAKVSPSKMKCQEQRERIKAWPIEAERNVYSYGH